MAKKAQTMIDVLNRRTQIEDELSRYQIQHIEDTITKNPVVQPIVQSLPRIKDTVGLKTSLVLNSPAKNDSLTKKSIADKPTVTIDTTVKNAIATSLPVKKDSVEAKNNIALNQQQQKGATTTTANKPIVPIVVNPPKKDTAKRSLRKPGEYYFDSTTKHYAAIILDKVDPLFVTEVKNAYFRFNREHYRNQTFTMNVVDLDATRKIVLIGDFPSAREAMNYMQSAKQAAASEVMPWLKADKYSFSIITDDNLPVLLEKKDLEQYRKFLVQNLPSKS
jgi:hypothetical protein